MICDKEIYIDEEEVDQCLDYLDVMEIEGWFNKDTVAS